MSNLSKRNIFMFLIMLSLVEEVSLSSWKIHEEGWCTRGRDGLCFPDTECAETNKVSPECSSAIGLTAYWINYANRDVKIAPSFSKAWLLLYSKFQHNLTRNTSHIWNHLVPSGKCVLLIGGEGWVFFFPLKFAQHYYSYTFNMIKCLLWSDPSQDIYICVSLIL